MRRFPLLILAIAEVVALVYATLVTWLLSSWFLDDAVVATMSTSDWYQIGAVRLLYTAVAACLFGFLIFAVNRFVAKREGIERHRVPLITALVAGGMVLLAGVAGSVQFMITKPYM